MTYQRKTSDVFVIESNYGYGWEETTASDARREAIEDLKAYRLNQPEYSHRLIKRRERETSKHYEPPIYFSSNAKA